MQANDKVIHATRCHRGKVKRNNQDCLSFREEIMCGVVADGVGGKAYGEVASQLAVDASLEYLLLEKSSLIQNPEKELANAIKIANEEIITIQRNEPKYDKMATTLTCLHITSSKIYYAWVGDSRIYRINTQQNLIEMLTVDHTLDQSKIDPVVSPRLYKQAPHILTRMVGSILLLKPDSGACQLQPSDIILACTDGLSNMVSNEQILEYSVSADTQSQAGMEALADRLLDRALDCGGLDNIGFTLISKT